MELGREALLVHFSIHTILVEEVLVCHLTQGPAISVRFAQADSASRWASTVILKREHRSRNGDFRHQGLAWPPH